MQSDGRGDTRDDTARIYLKESVELALCLHNFCVQEMFVKKMV